LLGKSSSVFENKKALVRAVLPAFYIVSTPSQFVGRSDAILEATAENHISKRRTHDELKIQINIVPWRSIGYAIKQSGDINHEKKP
tara:strand:+ start:7349 stop:7606 length:258 start_codon:yes stop_codon:yes gene_type:complete